MRRAAVAALVGAMVVASASRAASATVLEAVPGLGGIAKAGRWTSVRVTIDHTGADLAADLVLSWGDNELRRHIRLASSGRREFELYIRTADAGTAVRVRLVAGNADLQARDVTLRLLPPAEPVAVCVTSDDRSVADAPCSVVLPAAMLPRSARGYEVVDRVLWPPGRDSQILPTEQRLAFERWEALRRLDRAGDLGLTPGVTRPLVGRGLPEATARVVGAFAATYLFAFVLVGAALGRSRSRIAVLFGAVGLVTAAGVAAAHLVGRVGPAAAVTLHHDSLLQQLPGTAGSLLTMEAVAEMPAFDSFTVRFPFADASLETPTPRGQAAVIDEEGFPVLTGVFGLGSRQPFSVEAFTEMRLLDVAVDGETVRVTNASGSELRDCRFADGFSAGAVDVLKPSASVSARRVSAVAGPAFTCSLPESNPPFTESKRAVRTSGRTLIAVYDAGGHGVESPEGLAHESEGAGDD